MTWHKTRRGRHRKGGLKRPPAPFDQHIRTRGPGEFQITIQKSNGQEDHLSTVYGDLDLILEPGSSGTVYVRIDQPRAVIDAAVHPRGNPLEPGFTTRG